MLKKEFVFSTGAKLKVHEISNADLDLFMDLSNEAESHDDAALNAFAHLYYPVLAACTYDAPALKQAYETDPADLDLWFALCCELNTDWLGKQTYTEESIKLNGKTIVVKSRRPSVEMRLAQYQQAATQTKPLDNPKDEAYRLGGYIAAAAASFGDVPTPVQARHALSLKEFSLWHRTVKALIPEWYEDSAGATQEQAVETKKKENGAPGNNQVPT